MEMTRRQFTLSIATATTLRSSLFASTLSPQGISLGVVPDRVNWAHDPAAVTWNGTGSWWTDANNNQAETHNGPWHDRSSELVAPFDPFAPPAVDWAGTSGNAMLFHDKTGKFNRVNSRGLKAVGPAERWPMAPIRE
jgi:hypothetical protein